MSGVFLIWLCFATPLAAAASARIIEYKVPAVSSSSSGIVAGPDGALWFTENYKISNILRHSRIGRITTRGHFKEFPIPTDNGGPFSITNGPDGALWFTEADHLDDAVGRIGRITTAGHVTEFPVPTRPGALSHPGGIAAGPDGALWFTERVITLSLDATGIPNFTWSGKIGRITTSGTMTEFTTAIESYGITSGPDGALWFPGWVSGAAIRWMIGRITTDGVLTELPVEAGALTIGPDGALWGFGRSEIGRITTSGIVGGLPLPRGSGASAMTTGPDGALWFAEFGRHRIGRITTTGRVTEFRLPERRDVPSRRRFPSAITAGPDGAVWFTEETTGDSKFIGRITTAKLRNSCSRLEGRFLKRCRARKHALARCRRISNKKRRRSCIRRAERAYR